ncbi:hypothetical protein BKA57DRAFT_517370 [Linnemannia elongata]|nr:hypothetical protein BKA57DRAFT_517370 [Linnemannia elongata]
MAIVLPFALSLCLSLSLSLCLAYHTTSKKGKGRLPKNELEKLYSDNLLAWSSLTSGNKSSPRASDKDLEFFPCSFYLGMYMGSCQKYPGGIPVDGPAGRLIWTSGGKRHFAPGIRLLYIRCRLPVQYGRLQQWLYHLLLLLRDCCRRL